MWRPLLRFALLGGLLFSIERSLDGGEPLRIPAARVDALQREAALALGREPSAAELHRALAAEIDDALLLREALDRGYERDDPVVYRRLVQNLRFAGADPERDERELFEEAIALGLHRSDPVVRRRMLQRLRLEFESEAFTEPVEEGALRALYERDTERQRRPGRVRIRQLFYRDDRLGAARESLARLVARAAGPDGEVGDGDPFLHPAEQPKLTRTELAERFGAPFADAVLRAPVGEWSGPLRSAYGWHLVHVHSHEPGGRLAFEDLRDALRGELLEERRRRALERALEELRTGVEVIVEASSSEPTGLPPGQPPSRPGVGAAEPG